MRPTGSTVSLSLRWRTWKRSWTSWWTCTSSTLSTCRWTLPALPAWPWKPAILRRTVRSDGFSSTTPRRSHTCTRCLSARRTPIMAVEEEAERGWGWQEESASPLRFINPNPHLQQSSPLTPSVPQCCPSAPCRTCQWDWVGPQGGKVVTHRSPCYRLTTRSWSARPVDSASLGSGKGRTSQWGPVWCPGTLAGRDPGRATWRRGRRTQTQTLSHQAGAPCLSPPLVRDSATLCGPCHPERKQIRHRYPPLWVKILNSTQASKPKPWVKATAVDWTSGEVKLDLIRHNQPSEATADLITPSAVQSESHGIETAQKKKKTKGNHTVCKVKLCTAHSSQKFSWHKKRTIIYILYTPKSFIAAKPTALHVTHAIFSVVTAKFRISGKGKRERMVTYTCYAIL